MYRVVYEPKYDTQFRDDVLCWSMLFERILMIEHTVERGSRRFFLHDTHKLVYRIIIEVIKFRRHRLRSFSSFMGYGES